MDPARFIRIDGTSWRIEPHGAMRVPAIIYADGDLIRGMDDKVYEQAANVATLPGIVQASYVMPDAHWGYGFPIGGVAAFDPDHRLDLNNIHAHAAETMGVKLAISTDAHSVNALRYMRFGVDQARRGWLTADDVVNTRPLADLRRLLKR